MTRRPFPRVLIVDNDERVGTDLRDILSPLGYRIQVASGKGRSILKHARTSARNFRPHVAIVDLRLLDDYTDERSGLELLKSLQSAECILYSAYLSPEVIREALRKYGATDWVNKHDSPTILLEAIADATSRSYAHWPEESIQWPATWTTAGIIQALFGKTTQVPPGIVEDVVGQLFRDNKAVALEKVGGEVITSPPISRGHSVVLKVRPDGLEPVILKLASAERLHREQENYHKYVKDRLVGRFYAQLERTTEFWDMGGIVYSFIGSSLHTLPSFTAFYERGTDHIAILRPLRHFFLEMWRRHYDQSAQEESVPLFDIYDETLRLRQRLERFEDQAKKMTFPGVSVSLINPVSWVLRHASESSIPGTRQTVTHGDLHGDNLFVDGEHAWVIDFERTGPGHVLRDFVELEVDILTRLASLPNDDFSLFYELALILAESAEPAASRQTMTTVQSDLFSKALNVIAGLRSLANEATHYVDFREYLWALLLDALFVASLVSRETPQRDRALLLSSVLCDRLQRWNKGGIIIDEN